MRVKISLIFLLYSTFSVQSQVNISGGTTASGNYTSFTSAVSALNSSTFSGSVIVTIDSNYTQNTTSQILINNYGYPVLFKKKGNGNNPKITRTDTGTYNTTVIGGLGDAVIRLNGSCYVTFQEIDVEATQSAIEYGYFTYKASLNGCRNDTIRNCTVTMKKKSTGVVIGIYISNGPTSTSNASGTSATQLAYMNKSIVVVSNLIQNANTGIFTRGGDPAVAASWYPDSGITIGDTLAGNTIQNFGGAATYTSYGVMTMNCQGIKVSFNTISNSMGGGVAHRNNLYGIYSTNPGVGTYNDNVIVLSSKATVSSITCYIVSTYRHSIENIYNNSFLSDTLSFVGSLIFISANNNSQNKNIYNNSIVGTINRTGSGSITCYIAADWYSSYVVESFTNNNFSNINTTGSITGISAAPNSGCAVTRSYTRNIFSNWTSGSAITVFISGFNNNLNDFTHNQIKNITAGSFTGILYQNSPPTLNCDSNIISSITTSSGNLVAISTSANTPTIRFNKICNLTATNTNSSVIGINITAGWATISNNYIGKFYAPNAIRDNALMGIYAASNVTGGVIFYNTIYLDATNNSYLFGSSAIYAETTAYFYLRNNILVNTSDASGYGYTCAFRKSSTNLSNYNSQSNANLFYAGIPGPRNLIYFDGINGDQTLSSYKARVANRDSISVSEMPPFLSFNEQDSGFLHIDTSMATQIENGGLPISGVSSDYDGDTRNTTHPDIGADEGPFKSPVSMTYFSSTTTQTNNSPIYTNSINNHVIGVEVVTDGVLNPLSVTKLEFKLNGSTNLTDFKNAKVFYTGIKPTFSTYSQFGTTVYSPTNSITISGSEVLNRGKNYFWLTLDVTCLATDNNIVDAQCDSITIVTSRVPTLQAPNGNRVINSRSALSNTYTVGASGDYPNLKSACDDLNIKGMSGNTTFSILGDITEPGQVLIYPWIECNGSGYYLTIKPAASANPTIEGNVPGDAIIKIFGASRVILDGSNNATNSRNLTFMNTSISAPVVISMINPGINNGLFNNIIKNCNLRVNAPNANSYGIHIGGFTIGTNVSDVDSTLIQNNKIEQVSNGIFAKGTDSISAGGLDQLIIRGNNITCSANYNIGCCAIRVGNCRNSLISQNTISVNATTNTNAIGISLELGYSESIVEKNIITRVVNSYGGYGGKGIIAGTGMVNSALTISNNIVYGITGLNSNSIETSSIGIGIGIIGNVGSLYLCGGVKVYYNSVHLYGPYVSSLACKNTAFFIGTMVTNLDVRDNLFMNTSYNSYPPGAGSKSYSVYSQSTSAAFSNSNYNDYYVSGSQGLLGYLVNDQATLAAWKTATGKDVNSINQNPMINSQSNLRPLLGSTLLNAGVAIATVSQDYSGIGRSGNTPTIGAYEQAFDSEPPLISFTPLTNYPCTGNRYISNNITDFTGINISAGLKPRLYYKKSTNTNELGSSNDKFTDGWKYTEANNNTNPFNFLIDTSIVYGGVSIGDSMMYFFVAQDTATSVNVGIASCTLASQPVSVALGSSAFPVSGTIDSYKITSGGLSGVVTIGATGTYPNFTGTNGLFAAINANGLVGNLTAKIIDAIINESTATPLNSMFYGCGGPFTLTIKPDTGKTSKIQGPISYAAPLRIFSSNVIVDGSNNGTTTRNLTITNGSSASPQNISIGNSSLDMINNVTIKNIILLNDYNYGIGVFIGNGYSNSYLTPATFTNINIINNKIQKVNNGIYCLGNYSQTNTGLSIMNNDMTASGTNAIANTGIYINGVNGANIIKNNISNINNANAENPRGIWLDTGSINIQVFGNTISNINQTNTAANSPTGIYSGPNNTAVNILIDSNIISNLSGSGSGLTFGGIYSTTPSTTIKRNKISNIVQTGNSAGAAISVSGSNINLLNNFIDNLSQLSNANSSGILGTNLVNSNISGNNIATVVSGYAKTSSGITIIGLSSGLSINHNKISGIINTAYGANGIQLSSALTGSDIILYNNFISSVAGYGNTSLSGTQDNGYGIIITSGSGYGLFYNSVLLNTDQSISGLPSAINITAGVTNSNAIDLRNNLFVNTQTLGTNRFAIYCKAPKNIFSNINYNSYWSSGPNLGYIITNKSNIDSIRAGFGGNIQSIKYQPIFRSGVDLHLDTLTNWCLNGIGTPLYGIINDIDSVLRDTLNPDIGADEFSPKGFVINQPSGTICGPVDLTATSFISGSVSNLSYTYWKNSAATNPLNNPSILDTSGTYYIKATDTAGCYKILPITLNIIPSTPKPGVNTPVIYCLGATANALSATAISGYPLLWYTSSSGGSGSSTAPTPNTSVSGTTNYYVTQTSTITACESPRALIQVRVDSLPRAPITQLSLNYCMGSNASQLNASVDTGCVLLWYTTATGGTGSSTAPTPNTSVLGIFYFYVSQKSVPVGCEGPRDTITVTIYNLPPAPVIVSPVNYCKGATASPLSATELSGNSLRWYTSSTGGSFSSTSPTPSTISVGSTKYYVSQANISQGCEGPRDSITVVVYPLPASPTIISPVNYCKGDSASALTASTSGGNSLLWFTSSTGGTGNPVPPVPATSTVGSVKYYVAQVSNPQGCIGSRDSITVIINPLPFKPTVVTPVKYCQNAISTPLQATASSGNTLLWYNARTGGIGTSVAPLPSTIDTGIYIYYVSQKNIATGCEGLRDSIIINVLALPTSPLVLSPVNYCVGANAVNLIATPSTDCSLRWYPTITGGTPSTTPPKPATTIAGIQKYYVSQVNNSSNCEGERDSIVVDVRALPLPPGVSTPVKYCLGANASQLAANPTSGNTLRWYTVPSGGIGSLIAPIPITSITGSTKYYVSQKDTLGCEGNRDSITVTVNLQPDTPSVITPVEYCQFDTAIALSAISNGNSLLWYTSSSGGIGNSNAPVPSTSSLGSTHYYVSALSATNCEGPRSLISVHVKAIPTQPVISRSGSLLTITVSGSFQWYLDGNTISGANTNTYNTNNQKGTYSVKVTVNGCSSISSNYFMPGTGINITTLNSFKIFPNPTDGKIEIRCEEMIIKKFDIIVTDYLGRIINVKSAASDNHNWTIDLSPLPCGVYFLIIKNKDQTYTARIIKN